MEAQAHAEQTLEAPAEGAVEQVAKPETDASASRFAALAKKEKWIRKMLEDVNKQKKEIESKETDYKTNYVPKSRIKENFLEVALEAGLNHDQIANMLLNQTSGQQPDPQLAELRAEIRALKGEIESTKTNLSDREKTQYDQAVAQIKMDAESLLAKDSESFETLKAKSNAADIVTQYIEQTYKDEGVVIKVEDAATFIENELLEEAIAMARLKKVQDKLGLVSAPKEPPEQQQIPKQQAKTLTNGMTPPSKALNARDRRQRAILAFQGKLS